MSRRSQKRKLKSNGKHYRAYATYHKAYYTWRRNKPSIWRIFKWLKWKSERPHEPKNAIEYANLCDKYCREWWR